MERRDFFTQMGRCCVGVGLCTALPSELMQQTGDDKSEIKNPCEEKMDFAEKWLEKFMQVLDENLDENTKKKVMKQNGRACAIDYLKSIGRYDKPPVPFDKWIERAKKNTDGTYKVEGKTVYMTYMQNYQGKIAKEGLCLCPFVESKPAGLSKTYCHCSVGYIKESYSKLFGQPVKVELLDSVLWGGKRCKFKIELA